MSFGTVPGKNIGTQVNRGTFQIINSRRTNSKWFVKERNYRKNKTIEVLLVRTSMLSIKIPDYHKKIEF
jgi:hypothetical protein